MASTCENDITLFGAKQEIESINTWLKEQRNDQAPNALWAALYNLEQQVKDLATIPGVYEGSPDHAYGQANFKILEANGESKALFSFASKGDPCLLIVQFLSSKYPELRLIVEFNNLDSGKSGRASFDSGNLLSIEIEEAEYDSDYSEEDSDW